MALEAFVYNETEYFIPGQTLSGEVHWNMERPPKNIRANLYWYTSGIGSRDLEVVDFVVHPAYRDSGKVDFSFTLPRGPYSFSGRLVSVNWAVEFITDNEKHRIYYPFVMCDKG